MLCWQHRWSLGSIRNMGPPFSMPGLLDVASEIAIFAPVRYRNALRSDVIVVGIQLKVTSSALSAHLGSALYSKSSAWLNIISATEQDSVAWRGSLLPVRAFSSAAYIPPGHWPNSLVKS